MAKDRCLDRLEQTLKRSSISSAKAEDIIQDIYGGLRSACTYIGANKIKDFGKKTTFIQVNNTHNKLYEYKS
jgi:IMP dehydrogenase/GMP reductase